MKAMRGIVRAVLAAVAAAALAAGCGRGGAAGGSHFGEPFTAAPLVAIGNLLEKPADFDRKAVRVRGTIERQCPASGCWFFLRDEAGRSIRVELGDYLPRLPQNVGNTAEVEGEWIRRGEGREFIGTRVTFTRGGAR